MVFIVNNEEFRKQIRDKCSDMSDEDIDRILKIVKNLQDMRKWLDEYDLTKSK
jgi:NADH:ubiquinone oxidoreductase subunit E